MKHRIGGTTLIAFSNEVDTGSREENASKQEFSIKSAALGTKLTGPPVANNGRSWDIL
jgi:hypothetical protein